MKRVHIKCHCGTQAQLRPATAVYGEKATDPNAKLYVCARYPACDSYVAAHRKTDLPMGTLAGPALRRKRMEAHAALNRVMAMYGMSKKAAYRWLQFQLGLPEEEAHIAMFSEFRCQQVIDLCYSFTHSRRYAA